MGDLEQHTSSTWRIRLRYWAVQLPGIALVLVGVLLLQRWFSFPIWAVVAVVVAWVIKDAALYPLLKRAFDPNSGPQPHSPLGRTAIAREGLGKDGGGRSGYVQLGGELWLAELATDAGPVAPGGRVRVVDRQGLRLVVEPVGAHRQSADTHAET